MPIGGESQGFFRHGHNRHTEARGDTRLEDRKDTGKGLRYKNIRRGCLDVTFFRDDFRHRAEPARANTTKIDFPVDNLKVVFVDDVLHTGRTQRAALSAINSFGRPSKIELMVLIDRRFSRELPIQPDYKGLQVDVVENEKVIVDLSEGRERVYLESPV